MINSGREWDWMDDKQQQYDLAGWGFDLKRLKTCDIISAERLEQAAVSAGSVGDSRPERFAGRQRTSGVVATRS